MRSSNTTGAPRQADDPVYDPETGEIRKDDDTASMFAEGEGRADDGSVLVPTMTMSRINANPERAKINNRRTLIATISGLATKTFLATQPGSNTTFVGLAGEFAAIVWSDDDPDKEPKQERVYKSDRLFLPIGQEAAIAAFERKGHLAFSYAFYAEPSQNPSGYQWIARNLAKLDRNNLSAIDRLISHSSRATIASEHRSPLLPFATRALVK